MKTYLIRRVLVLIPLLLAISLLSFFIMQLSPGNYLDQLRLNPDISSDLINRLESEYGLNQNIFHQYLHWLWQLLHGNLGESFSYRIPVTEVIGSRIANTFILSLAAMIIAWGLAIPLGIYSATHRYSITDNFLSSFAFIGLSIPNFFFALILLFLIVKYSLPLPVSGMTDIMHDFMSPTEQLLDILRHLLVPAIVLGTASTASLMRQVRGQMLDVINSDYIRTARAKGLKERTIIYHHALRNALNPMITLFGYQLSSLLSGAALTETVTGWPGLGKMMLTAVRGKDIYLAMAGMMMGSFMLVIGNLISDLLLALNDPRIKYD
jgi:peptide/nickel transport system permease protein